MKTIVCSPNIFSLYQEIFIMNQELNGPELITISDLENLYKTIAELSNQKNVSKIVLANNPTYCKKLAQDIEEYSKIHYSNNNLEIEVI